MCHYYKKKGHIAPACGAKKAATQPTRPQQRTNFVNDDGSTARDVGDTSAGEISVDETIDQAFLIARLGEKQSHPFRVDMMVNGKPLNMEIDTGASVSLISSTLQRSLFPDAVLERSSLKLQTYTGEHMKVFGQIPADVHYGTQHKKLILHVVDGNGPTLYHFISSSAG